MRLPKICLSVILTVVCCYCTQTLVFADEEVSQEEILLIIDNALYSVPEDQPASMIVYMFLCG